jgi:protein ImuB
VGTHRPDQFRLKPPMFTPASFEKPERNCAAVKIGLPLRRYRPPLRAQVRIVNHRPASVFSEKLHGAVLDVSGPFRSSGEWWDNEAWCSEEWDIETAEGLYRVSHTNGEWLVEGCYDLR